MSTLLSALSLLLAGSLATPPPAAIPAGPPPRVVAEPAWEQPLDQVIVAPPVVIERDQPEAPLIVLALADAVEARTADDGRAVWRHDELPGRWLAAGGGQVAVAVSDGSGARLVLLDAIDGTEQARVALEPHPVGPPLRLPAAHPRGPGWAVPLEDGRAAVVSATGRPGGLLEADAPLHAPLLLVADRIAGFVGTPRRLVALEGPGRARRTAGIDPRTTTVGDGRLFGAAERELIGLRCREGRRERLRCRRLWSQPLGARVTAPPLVQEQRIIAASWDTFLYAFRPRSGHLVWRAPTGQRLARAPFPWRELVAVAGLGTTRVFFFRAVDGAPAGTVSVGDEAALETITTAPRRAGDLLVAPILRPPQDAPVLRALRIELQAREEDSPTAAPPGPPPTEEDR